MHDFTVFPFMKIVQAPQCPVSHPICVPVRFSSSRIKCTNSVRGSAIPEYSFPLILQVTVTMSDFVADFIIVILPLLHYPGHRELDGSLRKDFDHVHSILLASVHV